MEQVKFFYVNKGHLLTFEIGGLQTIKSVQEKLESEAGVPVKDQIWMLNDGTTVDFEKCMEDYVSQGAEPLFFIYDQKKRDHMDELTGDLNEITHLIETIIGKTRILLDGTANEVITDLPFMTFEYWDRAKMVFDMCSQYINDHQFLTLSWKAILANIENCVRMTRKKSRVYKKKFDMLDGQLSKARQLGDGYNDCLDLLKEIMLPVKLLAHSKQMRSTCGLQPVSLYQWMADADPNNCLEDLIDQLLVQYKTIKDAGDIAVMENVNNVEETLKIPDYVEIRGIQRRMQNIKQYQAKSAEALEKIKSGLQSVNVKTAPITTTNMIQEKVDEFRNLMEGVFTESLRLKDYCIMFRKSKDELVNNLNARIHGWIITAYDRLNRANNEIALFNERFDGLEKRMELIQQIRIVPDVFATGVTEIARRESLQKYFNSWQSTYTKLCDDFYDEENKKRQKFARAINNHFLRVLFRGMSDCFPEFYMKEFANVDGNLPPLDENYLEVLGTKCPTLQSMLDIEFTDVISRISLQTQTMAENIGRPTPETPPVSSSKGSTSRDNLDLSSDASHTSNQINLSDPDRCARKKELFTSILSEMSELTKELTNMKTDYINVTSTLNNDIEKITEIAELEKARQLTKKNIIEPPSANESIKSNIGELEAMLKKKQEEVEELQKQLLEKSEEIENLKSNMLSKSSDKPYSEDDKAGPPTRKLTRDVSMSKSMLYISPGENEGVASNSRKDVDVMTESKVVGCSDGSALGDKITQTRLNLRSMDMMISLHDISEGATVLIVWDERYQAFLLFSSSPFLHFVKESSLRRMNLVSSNGPCRTWFLGRVNSLDLCVIKKVNNRYNLPVDTRVYRVEVSSVPLDIRGQSASRSEKNDS